MEHTNGSHGRQVIIPDWPWNESVGIAQAVRVGDTIYVSARPHVSLTALLSVWEAPSGRRERSSRTSSTFLNSPEAVWHAL